MTVIKRIKKNKHGGKRERAGRPELPENQKCRKLSTIVNPNIWKFLQDRKAEGIPIAATLDEAIRGYFKLG